MPQDRQCPICGSPLHPLATYCKRCKKMLDRLDTRAKHDRKARVKALKQAWDGKGFRCYYSGIRLVEDNHRDPRYLTFDHFIPRKENVIVVTASVINDMKSDMSDDEFRTVVLQLAKAFGGGKFNEKVLDLKHWKR